MVKTKSAQDKRKNSADTQGNKAKSITLLSILCVVMAFLLVMTFIRFPIGIKNYNSVVGAIDLDYDMAGGTAYTLTLAKDNLDDVEDVNEVLDTLRYRLGELGYQTFSVKAIKSVDAAVKDYDIRIETKTTDSLATDIATVAAYGEIAVYGGTSANPETEILTEEKAIDGASYLGSYSDGTNVYYRVSINFTDYGYNEISNLIKENTSYYMSIKMGDETLLSGESAITETSFSGKSLEIVSSTEASAKQMALRISSGGLAYKYDISDPITITSPYGEKVAFTSVIAICALVLALIVASLIMFKGYGVIASLSLIAFAILETLMLIAVPGIVLSIGGVVGFAVATVMTAVGLTLIGKRIKDEFAKSEKTVKAAVKRGFSACTLQVISTAVVVGVASLLLLAFTNGAIKSFAVTLGIGTVIGAIAVLVFSRMFASLILPLANYSEKFLDLKREEK